MSQDRWTTMYINKVLHIRNKYTHKPASEWSPVLSLIAWRRRQYRAAQPRGTLSFERLLRMPMRIDFLHKPSFSYWKSGHLNTAVSVFVLGCSRRQFTVQGCEHTSWSEVTGITYRHSRGGSCLSPPAAAAGSPCP